MERKNLYKRLRKIRDAVDDLMFDLLEEMQQEEEHNEPHDWDVISVGKSKTEQRRIKGIISVVKELERENGSASYDSVVERAAKLGFDKDKVDAEIARLVGEAKLFEPVRYSQNYRTTSQ